MLNNIKSKRFFRQSLGKHLKCPKCGCQKYIHKLKGKDKRYFCTVCRYKFSLKTLAGFKHANLDYSQLYALVWCFSQNKTLKDAHDWSGASLGSIRARYAKLRQQLSGRLDQSQLWGHFICDESFMGRQKTGNQAIVMGAVSHDFKDLRLEVIKDQEQDSIEGFLTKHLDHTSLITSDGFSSYEDIEWLGYGHDFEVHDRGRFKKTVPIERIWGLFKTFITRTYHHIWKEKLPEYLVEFQFKFIHRQNIKNPLYLAKFLRPPVPDC